MSNETFDPQAFMNATYTEANDTVTKPVPAGQMQAMIRPDSIGVVTWASKDGTKSGLKLKFQWEVQDFQVKEALGRTPIVFDEIMLDLTDGGALDFSTGKNVRLGKLREATDLNKKGENFSFGMLGGKMALIDVKHRTYEDQIFAEAKGYARLP